MANSLYEALLMDLKNSPLQGEQECRIFIRNLLSDAYLGKTGTNFVHRYVHSKGKVNVQQEIEQLVYHGNLYLNYGVLLDRILDSIFPSLFQERKNSSYSVTPSLASLSSFYEVMEKTLIYYHSKGYFSIEKEEDVLHYAYNILSNYFRLNKVSVFSSKNGTRDYVRMKGSQTLLQEMKQSLGENDLSFDRLISSYAQFVTSSFISKYSSYFPEQTLSNNSESEKSGKSL